MTPKEILIREIIGKEEAMFLAVTPSEPASCQEMVKTFRRMREMSHWVWPEPVLESILQDLTRAEYAGRNLMTEKYACMENKLYRRPKPLINEIIAIETRWHSAVRRKYPLTFKARGDQFETYASCEFATYSRETIEGIYAALTLALSEKRNLVEERYTHLFKALGLNSIDQMEEEMKNR
ncbi:MAG: DUF4125 family protein [Desulfobacter sp.]|nr:MAG: DUF4125 family protein [Desulfobacter sp.]